MRYLSSDEIADAKNARGCGVPLDRIGGHLNVSVGELRHALGMEPLRLGPVAAESVNLWAVDQAHGVL